MLEGVCPPVKTGGGELYFSDVYCDRRLPEALRQDPVLYGECLGGALYWNDFIRLAKQAGFNDPRLVEDRPRNHRSNPCRALGRAPLYSATYRLFNLPLETPAGLRPSGALHGQLLPAAPRLCAG